MLIQLNAKPSFGTPCNGCGRCCAEEICRAGEIAFPAAVAPCPGLQIAPCGTRTYCQLVAIEIFHKLEPILQTALGIGVGCTMEEEPNGSS